ncbi:helix-turn-helix domain-containing protein [Pollutibacter soli]|uniref:helix-turn-helix domain-containing protein n=1 Tax=Pollutibacter soli TaxID=3034157 RepID=UPI003013E99F
MQVKIYTPHPALQEFVICISSVHAMLPFGTENVITPYPPTPFQSLIFYCNHPIAMSRTDTPDFLLQPSTVVIGPQYSRVNIRVHRQLTAIRVDFVPGGLYRMLGTPMHELFDGGFDALDFFGAEMKSINDQLRNTSSMEEGKNIVERFLLSKVKSLKQVLPFDSAMQVMLNGSGSISIEKIASHSCLSLKQFERKCKERIGMNPKMYARILKFSRAYRLHEFSPRLSWTEIAHEAGYFDQMHMIRDFKVFAGVNPSVIEHQLQLTPLRMQKDLRH